MKKLCVFVLLFFQCLYAEQEISQILTPSSGSSPSEENKKIIQTFYQAFSDQDTKKIAELMASNYKIIDYSNPYPSNFSKYDVLSQSLSVRMKAMHQALPDFKLQIFELISEGNQVVARTQITGVQKGPFFGVEPTQKPITMKGIAVFTIENGKIKQILEMYNEFAIMKQVGYIVL